MDTKEKQLLVTIFSHILILTCYSLYVYNAYIADNFSLLNDFKFWGKVFLVLIPVTIVAQIIIHIIFTIVNKIVTNEDPSNITDERDKLIELKAVRIAHWTFIFGFMIAMITQVMDMPPYAMFISLILSGFISGIVSEIAKLYFYRKGF